MRIRVVQLAGCLNNRRKARTSQPFASLQHRWHARPCRQAPPTHRPQQSGDGDVAPQRAAVAARQLGSVVNVLCRGRVAGGSAWVQGKLVAGTGCSPLQCCAP